MNYLILTFPRSGSHYLQNLIEKRTGVFVETTHDVSKSQDKSIISIIRNPADTLKSRHAMRKHYFPSDDIKILDKEYVEFYEFIVKGNNFLINYDDLINDPMKVLSSVTEHMDIALNDVEYVSNLVDRPDYKHLLSSKTSIEYDKVDLSSIDLSECNRVYNDALLKCISL